MLSEELGGGTDEDADEGGGGEEEEEGQLINLPLSHTHKTHEVQKTTFEDPLLHQESNRKATHRRSVPISLQANFFRKEKVG
jgi:hypothetical protein